ncbi:hypothetical protein [Paenibacillus periandrae]|nr:hypothetical protein [Paenibacillus periandrae]
MDAILEKCAGLDVHQETVVAKVLHKDLELRFVVAESSALTHAFLR